MFPNIYILSISEKKQQYVIAQCIVEHCVNKEFGCFILRGNYLRTFKYLISSKHEKPALGKIFCLGLVVFSGISCEIPLNLNRFKE